MEPRVIKISIDTYKNILAWPKVTNDSEWIYFGEKDDINLQIVIDALSLFVREEKNYVAIDRTHSFECSGSELINLLLPLLGSVDFILWNSSFSKAIEFSSIGVLRNGEKAGC